MNILANSLLITAASTGLALVLGVGVALALRFGSGTARAVMLAGSVVVLMLPPFWVAGEWMRWVGFAGAWRVGGGSWTEQGMPLVCSAWVLALMLWPLTTLWLTGAWDRLDARLFDALPELDGRAVWTGVLWPVARATLAGPMGITAVLALGQFSVPALFQARVWPAATWMDLATRMDAAGALVRSIVPALLAAALIWGLRGRVIVWPSSGTRFDSEALRRCVGSGWVWGARAAAVAVFALSLGVPVLSSLSDGRGWVEISSGWTAGGPAALRSGIWAALSATCVVALGARVAMRPRLRWTAMGMAVPWLLPGVFTGLALAWVSSTAAFHVLQGTAALVIFGFALRYSLVGWFAADRARAATDARVLEALRLDGAGGWVRWRHGVWPRSKGWILSAWYVVYLLCLWDVETLLLIVPPGGDTLALMMFNLLHYGHNAQVTALGGLLAMVALAPLILAWATRALVRGILASRSARPWKLAAGVASMVLVGGCSPGGGEATSRELKDSVLFERVEVIGGKGTGPGFFQKPRSVAVDSERNLYVVDMTGRVQRFDAAGKWVSLWQMPETDKGKAKGMAALADGSVLVVEPHYHRVNTYSPEGRLLGQWGEHGTNAGQLWFPRAVALGTNGDCYVSEYGVVERIQRFRISDGLFLGGFGDAGPGAGELNRAEGLGTDRAGRVYVADSCNHRVQIFSPEGRLLRILGKPGHRPGEFGYPYDVQIDASGNQFVCEFGNSRVQVFDASDRLIEEIGGPGAEPGRMSSPWSLCLDARGNLYVADSLNHRVLKFVRRGPAMSGGGTAGGPRA